MTKYFADFKTGENLHPRFVITQGRDTLLGSLPQYTHLEADYRIVGHILDAIQEGYTSTMVRANDTDDRYNIDWAVGFFATVS